jgi:sugar transferase (PEP-CTERM/EpsH1 system associated)
MRTQLQLAMPQVPLTVPQPLSRQKRLRVLHVVSCVGMGGTEHGILKVLQALGSSEFEHQICAMRNIDEDFAHRMKIDATISTVGTSNPGFQFPFFRLSRLMKNFRPHIVHSRNFGALEAIPAARFAGVPVAIHSEHGYELEVLKGLPVRRRVVCRAFYALADEVFTVSNELREYHARESWRAPEKIRVIYNGVNTEQFRPDPELLAPLKSKLGIPAGRVVIGTVGRVVPIKDHDTLLGAAEILMRRGRDIHVLVVGSGSELPRLRMRASASLELRSRTTFLGASDRVPELLNAMDLFVLPSISEGLSNTILEAMATGLPLVVTRAGGNPELVQEDRVGNLFKPRDVEVFAGLLLRLVDDPGLRERYGQAARHRAVEQFSLAGMAKNYRDLYLNLASQHGVGKGD